MTDKDNYEEEEALDEEDQVEEEPQKDENNTKEAPEQKLENEDQEEETYQKSTPSKPSGSYQVASPSLKDYSQNVINYPMYISEPKNTQGYISYTLKGTQIEDPVPRRYSEFYALREKLCERWPGVYIPNIPPKKVLKNKDTKLIDKRIRIINSFCLRLSTFPFLFNSPETKMFMTYKGPDLSKSLKAMESQNYDQILEKYEDSFPDYFEGYDLALGKSKLNQFNLFLKRSLVNVKNFQEVINKSYDKQLLDIGKYIDIIHQFESHEKYTITEYADNNENNLVFFNPINNELNEKVMYLGENLKNPYSYFKDWVEEEILDYEAMIEAFNSLNDLTTSFLKLQDKFDGIENDIRAVKYNQTKSIKTIFHNKALFHNKEDILSNLEKEKESTEQIINTLDKIIKLASFNMELYVDRFKTEKTNEYFKQLKNFAMLQKENNKTINEMWYIVRNGLKKLKSEKRNK